MIGRNTSFADTAAVDRTVHEPSQLQASTRTHDEALLVTTTAKLCQGCCKVALCLRHA
jgi:hypothetical protein